MMVFRIFPLFCACVFLWMPQIGRAQKMTKTQKRELGQARRAARALSLLAANGGGSMLREDIEVAAPPLLRSWIRYNKEALVGARANPISSPTRWGVATTHGSRLFLHITAWPRQGKVAIPRLHNSVAHVKFTGQDQSLKLTPNVNSWEIALPQRPRRDSFLPIIELLLDRPPQIGQASPPVVKPSDDGVVRLHARYAVTHGQMLRFEPQPQKNTIGYWVNENDWAEWSFETIGKQGYDIVLRYGCGDGQGGSEIVLKVGALQYNFVVKETGGFQSWREVAIGTIDELDGVTTVSVKPKTKVKNAIMDIQEIRLEPR